MFELEDSEDIKLERCRTDTGTVLKGRQLTNVEALDCEAIQPLSPSKANESRVFKILGLSVGWLMTIVSGVIVTVITAWLGFS